MTDVLTKITLVCRRCGHPWERTLRLPEGVPAPAGDSLARCVNCSESASMLDGMSAQQVEDSKLAHRVAAERHLLPKKSEKTAARAKGWRTANPTWARVYKQLHGAGYRHRADPKHTPPEQLMAAWFAQVARHNWKCADCGAEVTQETVHCSNHCSNPQNGFRLEDCDPVCQGCAKRRAARVRWQKAA